MITSMITIPGKIPIYIHPIFWVLAFAIGALNTLGGSITMSEAIPGILIWVSVIVISVIVHEFGHALTAVAFGQSARIDLQGMGGMTSRQGKKLKLWQDFLVVLNGPIFGFGLALVAFFLLNLFKADAKGFLVYALEISYYVNVFWTIVNLLPIQPLDGGKLLNIVLEALFGFKGIKIAYFLSLLFSAIITLLFFAIQATWAGILFLILTFESYRSWKASLALTEQDQNSEIQNLFKEAELNIRSGNREEGFKKLQMLYQGNKSGMIKQMAAEYMAQMLAAEGKYQQAYQLLYPYKDNLNVENLRLLHQAAYQSGALEEAIKIGNQSYQSLPRYDTALINSLCFALLEQPQPAIGWLQCAIRDGMPNLRAILSKSEFDRIRQNPNFKDLEHKASSL